MSKNRTDVGRIRRFVYQNEPEINQRIILGFIEKLEKFTPKERSVLIGAIQWTSTPIIITGKPISIAPQKEI